MRSLAALALALAAGAATAQSVSLQGMLGSKALLIVDGTAPRGVGVGETWMGVKVLATQGDQATLEIAGRRETLRVGDAPASVGGGAAVANGNRIVLTAGSGGHFVTPGTINGRQVQFLVDTGATGVSMSVAEAERIGLNYRAGQPVRMNTANGSVPGWTLKVGSIRIRDVEVHEVEAVVTPTVMPYILLGNSYLTRFQMKRENEQLVLERRF